MALYRPADGQPAIDPLVPCTAIRRVARGDGPATPPVPPDVPQRLPVGAQFIASTSAPSLSTITSSLSPTSRVFHRGNSQLQNPQLVLLFDRSLAGRPDSLEWHLYNCLNGLVSGPFAEGLRQYGAGPGAYAGYAEVEMPQGAVSTSQLAAWLESVLPSLPAPNTLYLLFPGPAMALGDPGFQYGADFCAYHTVLQLPTVAQGIGNTVPYAVMPFPTANGCTLWGQLSTLDALCMTASHELAEAMTDAVPGQGEDGPQGEIDDFAPCLWNPVPITVDGHGYKVQAYWSEADQRCWTPLQQNSPPPASPVGARFIAPVRAFIGAHAESAAVTSRATPDTLPPTPNTLPPTPTQDQVIDLIEETGQLVAARAPAQRELVERFTSRKFLLTAVAVATMLAGPALHYIPPADAAIGVTVLTALYTIVEGTVDVQRSQ